MPVWQTLFDELKNRNFAVVAVAMDTPEAARPHMLASNTTYVSLIDRDHHVSALFNMVNVPEAVWIDEHGRIVRPAENAGSYDGFRVRDRATGHMPEDAVEKTKLARNVYIDAVRDWVRNGAASRHVLTADAAKHALRRPGEEASLAHAHFQLAGHLLRAGRADEAATHFSRARDLHPDSWNIWRQIADKTEQGFAAGPEFWARVDSLGARRYRDRAEIEGMP